MASSKTEDKTRAAGEASRNRRFARYCLVLLLVGAAALCWLSLLTYEPTDWPASTVYPPRPVENAAGRVGAYIAHHLRYWLGGGAYMALLFASVAGGILLFGGRVGEWPWRLIGTALLVVSTSSAIWLVGPQTVSGSSDILNGSAGVLGISAGSFLLTRFGEIGAWLVLIVALLIGLMLTADNLMMKLPHVGRKLWQRRGGLSAVAGKLKPKANAAQPATAGATAARTPAKAPEKPAERPAPAPPKPPTPAARPEPKPAPVAKNAPSSASKSPAKPSPPQRRSDGDYKLPSADLLQDPSGGYDEAQEAAAQEKQHVLQRTLTDFNVEAEVVGYQTGPVITLFEVSLSPGVKVSQVNNLARDVARALAVPGVRVVSPLPGRDTIGIEVPNLEKEIVRIKELMNMAPDADSKMHLPLYLGKDAGGQPIVADLASMPHMLIAGTTGSGKSVCLNAIIMAILMTRTPEEARLILVDPKMVEMAAFENVPHLLCPIINDVRRAEDILEWAATKMDERYEVLKEAGVKNIAQYNRLSPEQLYQRFRAESEEDKARIPKRIPYYVLIVDELADLIMTSSKEVENHIIRIAQKARAVGIHMILATQRPSVNVVTGLIKSNMPCRISFRVASRQESRIVLDQNGADVLLGQGDMLFLQPGTSDLVRAQGAFVDDSEIHSVVDTLRTAGEPEFNRELMKLTTGPVGDDEGGQDRDELFDQAVEVVLGTERGSVSLLQRRLQIGYSRASRIIDQMAEAGILGDYKGSQARECMITLEDWQAMQESVAADQSGDSAANGEPMSV